MQIYRMLGPQPWPTYKPTRPSGLVVQGPCKWAPTPYSIRPWAPRPKGLSKNKAPPKLQALLIVTPGPLGPVV